MLTLLCAALLTAQPNFSIEEIAEGLKFKMPATDLLPRSQYSESRV